MLIALETSFSSSRWHFTLEVSLQLEERPPIQPRSRSSEIQKEKPTFDDLPQEEWDHWEVPFDNARTILDAYLDLRWIAPWTYRKGVSYFLRTQEDYRDCFQIQKFFQGKDREWKPYLARILGLDHAAVHEKYVLDELIEKDTALREQKRGRLPPASKTEENSQLVSIFCVMKSNKLTRASTLLISVKKSVELVSASLMTWKRASQRSSPSFMT